MSASRATTAALASRNLVGELAGQAKRSALAVQGFGRTVVAKPALLRDQQFLRSSASSAAETVRSDPMLLLLACLVVDCIGMMSYVLLLIGEVTDLFWAPVACFFLQYMFGSVLVSSVGFIEEILPFTDVVPTATIAWCITHLESLSRVRKALGMSLPRVASS